MPYTFRLTFHGLCAFVPERPLDAFNPAGQPDNPPGRVTVLLPDLAEPEDGLAANEPHLPFVRYRPRDLAASNPVTDRQTNLAVFPNSPNELRSCLLNREELSLSSNLPLPGLDIENRRPVSPPLVGNGEESLLFWLAKTPGQALSGLDGTLGANDPRVAGRMSLTAGTLRTLEIGPAVFDLPNGVALNRRRLATKVALEFAGVPDAQTFTLTFQQFGGGAPSTLVFGGGAGNLVEVEIKNREAYDLVGLSPEQNLNRADEFNFVYGLMDNPPGLRPVPTVVPPLGTIIPAGRPSLRFLCPPVAIEGGFA